MTTKQSTGGRPRNTPKSRTPFARWLANSGMTTREVADALGIQVSSLHSLKEGRFRPGLALALQIAKLTEGKVPVTLWVK